MSTLCYSTIKSKAHTWHDCPWHTTIPTHKAAQSTLLQCTHFGYRSCLMPTLTYRVNSLYIPSFLLDLWVMSLSPQACPWVNDSGPSRNTVINHSLLLYSHLLSTVVFSQWYLSSLFLADQVLLYNSRSLQLTEIVCAHSGLLLLVELNC